MQKDTSSPSYNATADVHCSGFTDGCADDGVLSALEERGPNV